MIEIMRKIPSPDVCIDCGGVITLLTVKGEIIYSILLANQINNIPINLEGKQITKFKCKQCGKEYNIMWSNGFPYPLVQELLLTNFLNMNFRRR